MKGYSLNEVYVLVSAGRIRACRCSAVSHKWTVDTSRRRRISAQRGRSQAWALCVPPRVLDFFFVSSLVNASKPSPPTIEASLPRSDYHEKSCRNSSHYQAYRLERTKVVVVNLYALGLRSTFSYEGTVTR